MGLASPSRTKLGGEAAMPNAGAPGGGASGAHGSARGVGAARHPHAPLTGVAASPRAANLAVHGHNFEERRRLMLQTGADINVRTILYK